MKSATLLQGTVFISCFNSCLVLVMDNWCRGVVETWLLLCYYGTLIQSKFKSCWFLFLVSTKWCAEPGSVPVLWSSFLYARIMLIMGHQATTNIFFHLSCLKIILWALYNYSNLVKSMYTNQYTIIFMNILGSLECVDQQIMFTSPGRTLSLVSNYGMPIISASQAGCSDAPSVNDTIYDYGMLL